MALRRRGPKITYSYSFGKDKDFKLYLVKTIDNDFNINELHEKYSKIPELDSAIVLKKWMTFLNFLKS